MKFIEDGSYLKTSVKFNGKMIEVLVDKCAESHESLATKIRNAVSGWNDNIQIIKSFLTKRLAVYDNQPDLNTDTIHMASMDLYITIHPKSEVTTDVEFHFTIPYNHPPMLEDEGNALTSEDLYKLCFEFDGHEIIWNDPSLSFDFDINCY